MNEPSKETRQIWTTLRRVAAETLERKRRLGQYAVVWRNGEAIMIGEDSDQTSSPRSSSTPFDTSGTP